jgi:hypothetical protein
VARLLILGGGCRGLELARHAGAEGHAVRVVTRADSRRLEIEAAGAECWIGDPDRLGTLRGALEGVTIACWLLGTATGSNEQLRALCGPRLRSFIRQTIDTTVRGLLYEAATGPSPSISTSADTLAEGVRIATEEAGSNSIPLALIGSDPGDRDAWLSETRLALARLLGVAGARWSGAAG